MRLLSLTVRSYRIHKEFSVTFDTARNVIGGPNESGKSTLAEAAHRALFLRSKTGGKVYKDMVSHHPGDPEVELTFEACGTRWELVKRFAGTKGSTRLSGGGASFRDDEAEAKLGELLKCDTGGGRLNAQQLAGVWSHLWVWQGSAGNDPSSHASEHRDSLLQRLQSDGISAVMQSATDQRVRERVAASYDELFTATGRPKAGSAPEIARAAAAEAESALNRARETADRLDAAASAHLAAAREIAEAEAALPGLRKDLETARTRLAEVATRREAEKTAAEAAELAAAEFSKLTTTDGGIRALARRIVTAAETLAPAAETEKSLTATEADARTKDEQAGKSLQAAADAVRASRQRHDHAVAVLEALEKSAEHARLADSAKLAGQLQREISAHEDALAKLPVLTARDLEALRQLDRAASRDAAALAAMAAGVEVIAAELAVTLDGQPLAPGAPRVLTDAGELVIGTGTRIRIHPGGGGSLAEARRQREISHRELAGALERHTVADLDGATAVFQQRQALDQQLGQLRTRWQALGGATLAADLARAATAESAAVAERDRRAAVLENPPSPATSEDARRLRDDARHQLETAEAEEIASRRAADAARTARDTAAAKLQAHQDRTAQARQALRDLETEAKVLETTHGSAADREAAIHAAERAKNQTLTALEAARAALRELAPDLLEADVRRLERAISQLDERRQAAHDRRVTARAQLTLDGSSDPHAELEHARARHAAACKAAEAASRHADAVKLLHELFTQAREGIHTMLVQPLADRISGYLQCLFGPAAAARVTLSETGIQGLELCRGDGTTFDFAVLSGGAREQVAAAVRLAMAEILAADHDGALPVIFDDAFAFADPDRVRTLQRMLDLAATRGLQVLVFTCTPADYSAFGAREVRMVGAGG